MKRYVGSVRVLGRIVMADTEMEAATAADARKAIEAKFWRDPDDLAAAMELLVRDAARRRPDVVAVHLHHQRDVAAGARQRRFDMFAL